MKTNLKSGFTLVEIMIVVAIIGLLAAIAIPNFLNARNTAQKNSCVNNMRLLSGSADQWALEKNKKEGDAITLADLTPYLKGGIEPKCPNGNVSYTFGEVGDPFPVTCAGGSATAHNDAFQGK